MAIKPSDITPLMVKNRITLILKLATQIGTDFELNLAIRQLSNWSKAKRRQVFRGILLLATRTKDGRYSSNNPITLLLKENNLRPWRINVNLIYQRALNRILDNIRLMENNERFIPEKVFTVNSIKIAHLLIEPENIEYLIKNNIMVLSESIKPIATNQNGFSLFMSHLRYMESTEIKTHSDFYKSLGLNTDLIFDLNKMKLIGITRILNNIQTIIQYYKNKDVLNAKEKFFLNSLVVFIYRVAKDLQLANQKVLSYININDIERTNKAITKELNLKLLSNEDVFNYMPNLLLKINEINTDLIPLTMVHQNETEREEIKLKDFDPENISFALNKQQSI